MPGMYAVTSMPLDRRTRATLRSAEFGFFGVVVYTRVQTPRFCGAPFRAGVFTFALSGARGFRTSWLMVGNGPRSGSSTPFRAQGLPLRPESQPGEDTQSAVECQMGTVTAA